MSGTYLNLTNNTLARLNEVQLTSSNFSNARGIQVQAQNAVNESIRYINQKEFTYPFNHATETKTLTAGTVRYSLPTSTKHVDYNTFRLIKDSDLGNSRYRLGILQYNDYVNNNQTKVFDIGFMYIGMGHIKVLSCDLENHLFFYRFDGGSSGHDRILYRNQILNYDKNKYTYMYFADFVNETKINSFM